MVDYIDEFLNGSTKAAKTYTIEEYLKEFVKGGDLVCITQHNDKEISGQFKRLDKYWNSLDPRIRHAELKKWTVLIRVFSGSTSSLTCHILSVLDYFSPSRERSLL